MAENSNDIDSHIESLAGDAKEWMMYFVNYMREKHPDLEEVISFQMPTYKLGSGKERNYVAFSTAKAHFSMHTMDFEYITALKAELSKPGNGKGCVHAGYKNLSERQILTKGIEEIIRRRSQEPLS